MIDDLLKLSKDDSPLGMKTNTDLIAYLYKMLQEVSNLHPTTSPAEKEAPVTPASASSDTDSQNSGGDSDSEEGQEQAHDDE